MAGLDVEALGGERLRRIGLVGVGVLVFFSFMYYRLNHFHLESHGIEHHQRLQENRKTREISMTQKQKPAPALPDSVVRDALATLHLNLPPGREEAMVW